MKRNQDYSADLPQNINDLAQIFALNYQVGQEPEAFPNRIPQPRPPALFGGQNFEEYKMGENMAHFEPVNMQPMQYMQPQYEMETEIDYSSGLVDNETILKAIKEQVEEQNNEVTELSLEGLNFGEFNKVIVNAIEKYKDTLKYLSLQNCALTTLKGFPNLPNLAALDLSVNQINGDQLRYIIKLSNLRHIMLRGLPIEDYSELEILTELKELVQMDLYASKLAENFEYKREKIFGMFLDLQILDNQDCEAPDDIQNEEDDDENPSMGEFDDDNFDEDPEDDDEGEDSD